MNRNDSVDCFQLNDDQVFNEQVDFVSNIQSNTVEVDFQRPLALQVQAFRTEFVRQACSIRTFQKARTKRRMNLHGAANDSARDMLVFH
jgi:hypothetical protein